MKNRNFIDDDMVNNINVSSLNLKKTSIIKERVNLITTHMYKQYLEHQKASANTGKVFDKILENMEEVAENLRELFKIRGIAPYNIYCETDSDKSVGIINILWHSISFIIRGNTKPQALYRKNNPPLFTGRIIALNGDFLRASFNSHENEYPDILKCEIASLYIPADTNENAIIKIKHLGDQEFLINQIDAPKEFLIKTIEIICGGGVYHENEE